MARPRTQKVNIGYSEDALRRRIYFLVRILLLRDMPIGKVRSLCRAARIASAEEEGGEGPSETLAEKAITESLVKELIDG